MNEITCEAFRARLERELRGRPGQADTSSLAWHEHLLGCAQCRALLEAEEALEALLATLPEPRLPDHLTVRVLARLDQARAESSHQTDHEQVLDRLLDLDHPAAPPPGLGARVLAGLSEARGGRPAEASLDALLDRMPAPEVPDGLADRVLEALEPSRRPAFRLLRGRGARRLAMAASILIIGLIAWRVGFGPTANPAEPALEAGDEELIAYLDVLERWSMLMDDDPDLLLLSVDPLDEALIETETFAVEDAIEAGAEEPKKG